MKVDKAEGAEEQAKCSASKFWNDGFEESNKKKVKFELPDAPDTGPFPTASSRPTVWNAFVPEQDERLEDTSGSEAPWRARSKITASQAWCANRVPHAKHSRSKGKALTQSKMVAPPSKAPASARNVSFRVEASRGQGSCSRECFVPSSSKAASTCTLEKFVQDPPWRRTKCGDLVSMTIEWKANCMVYDGQKLDRHTMNLDTGAAITASRRNVDQTSKCLNRVVPSAMFPRQGMPTSQL